MTKKSRSSQSSKRTIIIVTLAVLALITGGATWISTANSASTTAPVLASQRITPLEYQNQFGYGSPHLLIDVRTPQEFTSGHIQNAINIPVETLQARLDEVPGGDSGCGLLPQWQPQFNRSADTCRGRPSTSLRSRWNSRLGGAGSADPITKI